MKINTATVSLAATLALASIAQAGDFLDTTGDLSPTNERVRLSLGISRWSTNTNLRLDSSAQVVGTSLNLENDLGLSHANFEPKFQALVRVEERHRLRFDYFTLDRNATKSITNVPVVFRDVIFLIGDPVQTTLNLRMLGITYGYSFIHGEKFELAGTFGLNETDISTRAEVITQTRHIDQQDDQAGPFPTVGLDSTWVLSKRFYLDGRAQYLKVNLHQVNGSLGLYEFDALYRLRPNVSFALGYNVVKANLASSKPAQAGFFNFSSKGPELFVRVAF